MSASTPLTGADAGAAPRLFRVLSAAQQSALANVARCGSPRVPSAHTTRRTTRKLVELGYIEFSDAQGCFLLTARGNRVLPVLKPRLAYYQKRESSAEAPR